MIEMTRVFGSVDVSHRISVNDYFLILLKFIIRQVED